MPYLYTVERKISINIIVFVLIAIFGIFGFVSIFLSNYIQKKRLKSIYDYMAIEDYNNASFIFNDLLSKHPLDKTILITGIDLYYDMILRSGNKDIIIPASENITKYAKQILLTSKFVKNKYLIYQRLGYGYQMMGKSYYLDSYDAYTKAIKNGDTRVTTAIELSKICYEIGYYKEAINLLENVLEEQIKENPNSIANIELYYELANSYSGNKDYTKAIQTLSSIEGKFNGNIILEAKVYAKLGELYLRQGLYKESEFFYKKALLLDEKNPELYYSIGTLYTRIKRLSEAVYMFREALKIDNSYTPAREALRRL